MRMTVFQELVENMSRPMISDYYGGLALIDTGAEIPVCTLPPSILVSEFNATLRVERTSITGFGGNDYGSVYNLEMLRFKDLIYPNIPVFVPENKDALSFRWILSAAMFDHLEYTLNMKDYTITINIPDDESNIRNLRIHDKDGKLHVLCESGE